MHSTTEQGADHWALIDRLLALALDEDIGTGDVTTELLIPADARVTAEFRARQSGVVAGLKVVDRLFHRLNPDVRLSEVIRDGERMKPGSVIARVEGPARAILTGERLALNIMQRMCAIATVSRKCADAVDGTNAKVCDTRKTMPGMRALDKLAVYIGGASNHRQGLFDMVLIKDNHLAMHTPTPGMGRVASAVQTARAGCSLPVQVEVDTLDQLREALEAEPDMVLLDNMDSDLLREAVHMARTICAQNNLRRPLLEASGGITMETLRMAAEAGVDRISIGALTHSVKAIDLGLDVVDGE